MYVCVCYIYVYVCDISSRLLRGTSRECMYSNVLFMEHVLIMNEARLSHLPFWGPSEGFFLINSTAVGLTRMKRSSFRLRVRVNPWVIAQRTFHSG